MYEVCSENRLQSIWWYLNKLNIFHFSTFKVSVRKLFQHTTPTKMSNEIIFRKFSINIKLTYKYVCRYMGVDGVILIVN